MCIQPLSHCCPRFFANAPLPHPAQGLKRTAFHESGHALVAMQTPGASPIHKATIVPRGDALGMVTQVRSDDEREEGSSVGGARSVCGRLWTSVDAEAVEALGSALTFPGACLIHTSCAFTHRLSDAPIYAHLFVPHPSFHTTPVVEASSHVAARPRLHPHPSSRPRCLGAAV